MSDQTFPESGPSPSLRALLDAVRDGHLHPATAEAEVRRLERLGAKRIGNVHTWCVMEAPTGQRFCVVRVQNPGFADMARTWKE